MGIQHAPLYTGASSTSPCQLARAPLGPPASWRWLANTSAFLSTCAQERSGHHPSTTNTGSRAPTHWACRDTADGKTAGFHGRNKVRTHTEMETLTLPVQKNQTTDPQRKTKPWVCLPLLNQICPGSYNQII